MPLSEPGDPFPDLAVWGGIECSHIRVGEVERDQCAESRHFERPGDLDLIAGLGLQRLRYPLLWATIERLDETFGFGRAESQFARLRALQLTPIAGFLHHGSGPGGLDPLHPEFIPRFARFADEVAARFDWIEDFTPINEPVTTARFSYLYGHWHPHVRDESAFLRAVVATARATAAAMNAIRRRIPKARLIQTEDFGRVFATSGLAYQADYENARRFLGIDLATGRVDRRHRFWPRLIAAGVTERELDALADSPCPPDVLGIDHYLTSDRFLDTDASRHRGAVLGGNGRDAYVDVAATRALELTDEVGVLPRLRELHARYALPLALTEVHNGSTREEQLRWLLEAWDSAQTARSEGAEVVAVTSWALLGARDWNSLMMAKTGHYESGAFDLRCDPPRVTAVGRAVASLANTGSHLHPLLELGGWWRHRAPPVAGLPHLSVVGAAADLERFGALCRLRRVPITSGIRKGSAILGDIRIERPRGAPLRFHHARTGGPDGPALEVEAPAGADFGWAANAFLDLVIDGETGALRLNRLGRDNQYSIVQRAKGSPDREADPARLRSA